MNGMRVKRGLEPGRGAKPGDRAGEGLSKGAEGCLAALAPPDAFGMPDPAEPGAVIVRASRNGVSLGAGRFLASEADELIGHDLATWSGDAGRGRLRLSDAGRARLRRRAEAPDEAFRRQHGEVLDVEIAGEGGRETVALDAGESPLAWLRRRRDRSGEPLIDEAAFAAGERLRRDLTLGAILPSVTMGWDRAAGAFGGGGADAAGATDVAVAARQRATAALEAVGADFADLLIDLCAFLKGLELIERERDWPPRSAKVVIRLALARLADHYGLRNAARGPDASRGIRSWRAVVIAGGRAD